MYFGFEDSLGGKAAEGLQSKMKSKNLIKLQLTHVGKQNAPTLMKHMKCEIHFSLNKEEGMCSSSQQALDLQPLLPGHRHVCCFY